MLYPNRNYTAVLFTVCIVIIRSSKVKISDCGSRLIRQTDRPDNRLKEGDGMGSGGFDIKLMESS